MFTLEGKRVFIYGKNNDYGRRDCFIESIKRAGGTFAGIIDRNPDEGMLTIDEVFADDKCAAGDSAFILNFRDKATQNTVAESLYKNGYRNIVFLPGKDIGSVRNIRIMRKAYNLCLYGAATKDTGFPTFNEIEVYDEIICEYNEYVSFWMDIDSLHSDTITDPDVEKEFDAGIYYDVKIRDLKYYFDLYDYLFLNGEYPLFYMKNNLKGRDEKTFLDNRKAMFMYHQNLMKYDPVAVEDSPVLIEWDEKDKDFKIRDGYHRTVSYIRAGYDRIPVICKKEEYERYNASNSHRGSRIFGL